MLNPRWLLPSSLLAVALASCSNGPPDTQNQYAFVDRELEFRARLAREPISVSGRVVDTNGLPVANAELTLGEKTSTSNDLGEFRFAQVPRHNELLQIHADGYRRELLPVHLHRPLPERRVQLPALVLRSSDTVRLLFGGDISMGRRFLDPSETTASNQVPSDHPDALILASDPLPGTKRVLKWLKPLVSEADFAAANLETVVTRNPKTPDLEKSFVFFTLPESLPALRWLGLDYVGLANNHVYDYYDLGVRDTLKAVNDAQLANSGAGEDIEEAFVASRQQVAGVPLALLAFVSIEGIRVRNDWCATETRPGAADLNDKARIAAALTRERDAGQVPIAMIHTGYEYMEEPPDDNYTVPHLESVIDSGAELVVAHHPHVPEGFQFHAGRLIAHSLGNFVFDQERVDTMLGAVLKVDIPVSGPWDMRSSGHYIEDFVPKLIGGTLQDQFLRRLAQSSERWGAAVVPYAGEAWLRPDWSDFTPRSRELRLKVHVDATGNAILDLRDQLEAGESVSGVVAEAALAIDVGRDLLVFGDMEDMDIDDDDAEASRWYTTGLDGFISTFPCVFDPYRGAVALCSVRKNTSLSESTLHFRNRVRVLGDKMNLPNKDLSLVAYVSGDNAGAVSVDITYGASIGEREFGTETLRQLPAGSYDWTALVADLHMPKDDPKFPRTDEDPFDPILRTENARALDLAFHHAQPERGDALFRVDDVAIVAWTASLALNQPDTLATPHANDFLRVEATPGDYELVVQLKRYLPNSVATLDESVP